MTDQARYPSGGKIGSARPRNISEQTLNTLAQVFPSTDVERETVSN